MSADDAPLPDYATRRLQSRGWRLRTSWWVLPPLVSIGVLCWAGYFWAGFKTRRRKYFISAGAWLLMSSLVVLLPGGWYTSVIGISCWFLPTMQAVVMNQAYLRERAVADL